MRVKSSSQIAFSSLTNRGVGGWLIAVVILGFYTLYYWWPERLHYLTAMTDPVSQAIRGKQADQWFMYAFLYTVAVLVMGGRVLLKYRHSRYHLVRTSCIMTVQLIFAFMLPYLLERIDQPSFYFSYFWPLFHDALWPEKLFDLWHHPGKMGTFFVAWSILVALVAVPVLTYYFGKRWYCSWVCGCGGLANTFGDEWRHLSNKRLVAWRIERWSIHGVLVLILGLTLALWINWLAGGNLFGRWTTWMTRFYKFTIVSLWAGVIGVGFYPLMGTRVWCRFGCPQAAILGLIQRFYSRFRITTNGAQCISCGNCSKYCEMGIDVKWYAQRGQDVVRASCVGCGMCSTVCPRGVLNLENGPRITRNDRALSLRGKTKAR